MMPPIVTHLTSVVQSKSIFWRIIFGEHPRPPGVDYQVFCQALSQWLEDARESGAALPDGDGIRGGSEATAFAAWGVIFSADWVCFRVVCVCVFVVEGNPFN